MCNIPLAPLVTRSKISWLLLNGICVLFCNGGIASSLSLSASLSNKSADVESLAEVAAGSMTGGTAEAEGFVVSVVPTGTVIKP
jgi:hypothetical protein